MRGAAYLLLTIFLGIGIVRAEKLSGADREALLENIEKIREAAATKVDARFRIAMAAYRSAMGSEEAIMKFYLDCIAKVNFEAQQKKTSEFIAWKHAQSQTLGDPAFRLALRYQLAWLMLSIEASSEKAKRKELVAEAKSLLDRIMADARRLNGCQSAIEAAPTSSIFAKRFEIANLETKEWPQSPVQLEDFYGKLVFPPLREAEKTDELRAAWVKRIQQEGAKIEAWSQPPPEKPDPENKRRNDRRGTDTNEPSPAYEKFVTEIRPELEWRMEMDLFRHGDERNAAMRMLEHLDKYPSHRAHRNWTEVLKALLTSESGSPSSAAAQ